MFDLRNSNNIFIDFDGVIVDSNRFKELAIEKSIFNLCGETKENLIAIKYFNENAGIAREKKLALFFKNDEVKNILKIYSKMCNNFFEEAHPTPGLKEFLKHIKSKRNQKINLYVLSGGEKNEIKMFLKKHHLINYFEEILASEKNKIDHLKNKQITKNDIFIGDSKNDLKTSLKTGIRFVLFEEYKSFESFPSLDSINNYVSFKTKNFQTFIEKIII